MNPKNNNFFHPACSRLNRESNGQIAVHPCACESPVRIKRILPGGGSNWLYAVCGGGSVLAAAHEDDAEAMKALRAVKKQADDFFGAQHRARLLHSTAYPSPQTKLSDLIPVVTSTKNQ